MGAPRRKLLATLLVLASATTNRPTAHAQRPAELEVLENTGSTLGPEIGASGTSSLDGASSGRGGMVGGRVGSPIGRVPYNVAQPGGWSRISQSQLEILPSPSL